MKTFSILALFLGLFFQSCQSQPSSSGVVDPMTFQKQLSQVRDKVILDVRTPEEFAGGYIENAILMDYYDPGFGAAMSKLDKTKTYFVYCAVGGRSHSVYQEMQKAGFKNVIELDGGFDAWKASKLPVAIPK